MKRLCIILSAFLVLAPICSQAVNTKGWLGTTVGKGSRIGASGLKLNPSTVPTHNDLANGVIYYKLATHQILGYIDGSWIDMGVSVAGALTLDDVFNNGKIIDGATDSNNSMQVGDGTDAITFFLNGANDVRISSTSGSDISIAPVGGDTSIVGTLDVSGSVTVVDITTSGDLTVAGDVDITVTDTSANGVYIDGSTITSGDVLQIEYDAGTLNAGKALIITEDTVMVFQVVEDGLTTIAGTAAGTASLTLTAGDLVLSSGRVDVNGDAGSADILDITRSNSATDGDAIDINLGSATIAGDGVDISWAGAGTGDGIVVNLTNNLAGNALDLTGAGIRTAPIVNIVSNGTDGGTDDNVIRVIQNGALDSPIVFLGYTTANSPGNAISIDMNTNLAGEGLYVDEGGTARTGSAIEVNADGTGTHSVIDLNVSANAAITALDITGSYNGSPAGDLIKLTVDDGDNLDTGLINLLVGTGNRGVLVNYVSTGTDSGTTSYVYGHVQSGILDSSFWRLEYDTAASTGDGSFYEMGTNVAGRAIIIDTSATGVSNEGAGVHITGDGNLVQGASLLWIDSSGDMAHADTRIFELNETGSDQASSYAVGLTSTNNGGIIISSGSTDHAIDIVQGIVDMNGNKIEFFDAAVGIYSQADTFLDIFADGALRIGDSSGGAPTNYANFASNGSFTLVGTARETKTVWIAAQDFQNVSGAAEGLVGIAGIWQLSDAASDSLTTTFYVPNGYVEGTDMVAKVHWSSAQTSNTATFDGAWLAVVAGEDTSAAGTGFTEEDDAAAGTADFLNITEGFTITSATIDKGDQVILNILRLGSGGNDNLTDDVDFQGVAITYTADRL